MVNILVFGATGYTGQLIVEALVARGVRPILVGRSEQKLQALASLHGDLSYRLADLSDRASLAGAMNPGEVLISAVGPFQLYGRLVAEMALERGVHYLDTTGEVDFVQNLQADLGEAVADKGLVFLPAFGYDFVPGFLAVLAASQTTDQALHSVEIGYFAGPLATFRGDRDLSSGTRETIMESLTQTALVREEGRLHSRPYGSLMTAFELEGRRRKASLASGTEVLWLSEEFPSLDTVHVYNGWFPGWQGKMGAAMARLLAKSSLGRRIYQGVKTAFVGKAGGPDRERRALLTTEVVAKVKPQTGQALLVQVSGPSTYQLTADLLAAGALAVAEQGKVVQTGIVSPLAAFGSETFEAICHEAGLRVRK